MNLMNPCKLPPPGWYCTREGGHDGPCAAWPMKPCNIFQRWRHRHKRNTDRQYMVPALRQYVPMSDKFLETFNNAWALYVTLPGQEHWHCSCAVGKTPDSE